MSGCLGIKHFLLKLAGKSVNLQVVRSLFYMKFSFSLWYYLNILDDIPILVLSCVCLLVCVDALSPRQ